MTKPNLIINLPMEIKTFAQIAKACPDKSVMKLSDDGTQVYVYFESVNVLDKEDKPCAS